jgi:DNA-binding MarR family transcriptional regulator
MAFGIERTGSSVGGSLKTWALTQTGQQRADAIAGRGFEGRLLCSLKEEGTATISDLCRVTGLDASTIRAQLNLAKQRGYVMAQN